MIQQKEMLNFGSGVENSIWNAHILLMKHHNDKQIKSWCCSLKLNCFFISRRKQQTKYIWNRYTVQQKYDAWVPRPANSFNIVIESTVLLIYNIFSNQIYILISRFCIKSLLLQFNAFPDNNSTDLFIWK